MDSRNTGDIVSQCIWKALNMRNIGSFETGKTDIFRRRNYLKEKVITSSIYIQRQKKNRWSPLIVLSKW